MAARAATRRGELRRAERDHARPRAAHGVRRGALPQHRRVLGGPHRHLHDPGRYLHACLRLLCRPDILNHNIETVPSLYPQVRPKGRYPRSLELLQRAKRMDATVFTKSGIMLGLGEEIDEVIQVFRDLRAHDVEILTVGQYLRPTANHLPIARYVTPDEFAALKVEALQLGFRHVESGPLVRSSYHAANQVPARAAAG